MVNELQDRTTKQTIIGVTRGKLCFSRLSMVRICSKDAHEAKNELLDGSLGLQKDQGKLGMGKIVPGWVDIWYVILYATTFCLRCEIKVINTKYMMSC